MKYVFVYDMPDGKVYKTEPAPGISLARAKKDISYGYTNLRLIDVCKLPDRIWRQAWKLEGKNLLLDYTVIRDIIRRERNKLLCQLDTKVLAAQRGKNSELEKMLELEAQRLRDIPQDPRFKTDDKDVLKEILLQCTIKEG